MAHSVFTQCLFLFSLSLLFSLTKVKDCQLSCIVNRDLTRRIKPGSEAAWSKRVLSEDVQVLLRLIHNLDKMAELWEHAPCVSESTNDGESMDIAQPREVVHSIITFMY